jgi:signal peptidase
LLAFQWFSPILPKLPWAIQTLVGIFVPVLSLNIVHSIFRSETHQSNRGQQESPAGWIGTGLVCILSVWFASGVFTYYPSIIVTGSMTPTIDVGDMVIAKKVDARAVRVGDIVQYRRDKMVINHRVIDIQNTDNGEVFTTKGDANPSADPPVTSKQIIGKDVLTIPKIGLLSMFLRGELGPESQQRYEIPGTASP